MPKASDSRGPSVKAMLGLTTKVTSSDFWADNVTGMLSHSVISPKGVVMPTPQAMRSLTFCEK